MPSPPDLERCPGPVPPPALCCCLCFLLGRSPTTTVMLDRTKRNALSIAYSVLYIHSQTLQLYEVGIFPTLPVKKLPKEVE